jgi:hypothetical protein
MKHKVTQKSLQVFPVLNCIQIRQKVSKMRVKFHLLPQIIASIWNWQMLNCTMWRPSKPNITHLDHETQRVLVHIHSRLYVKHNCQWVDIHESHTCSTTFFHLKRNPILNFIQIWQMVLCHWWMLSPHKASFIYFMKNVSKYLPLFYFTTHFQLSWICSGQRQVQEAQVLQWGLSCMPECTSTVPRPQTQSCKALQISICIYRFSKTYA